MATFKPTVKKEKMRKDKTWKVLIRLTHGKRVAYLPTSMYVSKKDMTASFRIKNQIVLDRCDELIREYRARLATLDLEFNDLPIEAIAARLKEKATDGGDSFTEYAGRWMASTSIKGIRNYKSAVNALRAFFGKDNILFTDITANTMKAFGDSLAGKPRAQSLYTNGIVKIFNDARDQLNDEDSGIIKIKHSLKKYSAPRQNVAEKRALDIADIIKIMRLPDKPNGGAVCRRDLARDCFLLSFFLMGMNSADLYSATEYDGECITYQRTKTKGRRADKAVISVRVHPAIKPLVDKYRGKGAVFCFCQRYSSAADFNRAINIGLKEIGTELGIEGLQFYAARHSMATIAVNEAGISKYVVNDMLNHVEPSMRVTDLYIKKDFTAINEANYSLIGYVLGKAGLAGETAKVSIKGGGGRKIVYYSVAH